MIVEYVLSVDVHIEGTDEVGILSILAVVKGADCTLSDSEEDVLLHLSIRA